MDLPLRLWPSSSSPSPSLSSTFSSSKQLHLLFPIFTFLPSVPFSITNTQYHHHRNFDLELSLFSIQISSASLWYSYLLDFRAHVILNPLVQNCSQAQTKHPNCKRESSHITASLSLLLNHTHEPAIQWLYFVQGRFNTKALGLVL